jgi:hypothetical protein
MSIKKQIILAALSTIATNALAQKEVVNEEINITKERQIELQKANRIFDKIPPVINEKSDKKMTYSFYDRKPTAVEETKFEPNVVSPVSKKSSMDDLVGYKNYFKIGVGNFGRFYAETFINSNQDSKLVWGISGLHNSTKRGPVEGENSASSLNKIKLDGKYHQENYELKLDMGYERRNYYFYGYDTAQFKGEYSQADLRQLINIYNFNATFENTKPKPKVDYKLVTGIRKMDDYYRAYELDWGTTFTAFFPIIEDKVTAILNAESYLTQWDDSFRENQIVKRNLFRVEPMFRFDIQQFSAKVGFKAVNQYDQQQQINETKGYPTVNLSYKLPSMIYFFAVFDGDMIRNTLYSFVNENPYLGDIVNLRNTYKNQDFYIGSRGDMFNGVKYNAKFSYGKYQNLYFFTPYDGTPLSSAGKPINTTKYANSYENDEVQTNFFNVSTEFSYMNFESWKPNIKMDYNYYQTIKYPKPYHKPAFTGRWGNTFLVTNKLVSSLDFYYMGGIYAQAIEFGEPKKLKDIADLNAEITYLFSPQFSAFVKLNNIFGQNYQRYYNYPQMGLNFVAGINVAL